jgi:hypothetical protein
MDHQSYIPASESHAAFIDAVKLGFQLQKPHQPGCL